MRSGVRNGLLCSVSRRARLRRRSLDLHGGSSSPSPENSPPPHTFHGLHRHPLAHALKETHLWLAAQEGTSERGAAWVRCPCCELTSREALQLRRCAPRTSAPRTSACVRRAGRLMRASPKSRNLLLSRMRFGAHVSDMFPW